MIRVYSLVLFAIVLFMGCIGSSLISKNPIIGIPSALIIIFLNGIIFYTMNHIQHEICHNHFGKNHNEFWANILITYPLGITPSYRRYHHDHHRFFGTPRDPDFEIYGHFPKTKEDFLKKIFIQFSGVGAAKAFFLRKKVKSKKNKEETIHLIFVQTFLFFFLFIISNNIITYILFWLFPIVTITKGLAFLRTLAEHGNPQGICTLRNFNKKSFVNIFFGSFGFIDHAIHHINPTYESSALYSISENIRVPERLRGFYSDEKENYVDLIMRWYHELPKRNK